MVAKKLKIPLIHACHTMYEDYLHYIGKGKVIRQSHVKYLSRLFANHATGVVCPSERVIDTLRSYGVIAPLRVILLVSTLKNSNVLISLSRISTN